jgi:hypothetical protein
MLVLKLNLCFDYCCLLLLHDNLYYVNIMPNFLHNGNLILVSYYRINKRTIAEGEWWFEREDLADGEWATVFCSKCVLVIDLFLLSALFTMHFLLFIHFLLVISWSRVRCLTNKPHMATSDKLENWKLNWNKQGKCLTFSFIFHLQVNLTTPKNVLSQPRWTRIFCHLHRPVSVRIYMYTEFWYSFKYPIKWGPYSCIRVMMPHMQVVGL